MADKNKTKEKRRVDKGIVWVTVISVLVLVGAVLAIVLPDRINAAIKLREYTEFIENLGDDKPIVVISSPLDEGDAILSSAEKRLEGDEAKSFIEKLKTMTENVKYSDTNTAEYGIWETKIVIYSTNDKITAYISENGFYLTDNTRKITYVSAKNADISVGNVWGDVRAMIES